MAKTKTAKPEVSPKTGPMKKKNKNPGALDERIMDHFQAIETAAGAFGTGYLPSYPDLMYRCIQMADAVWMNDAHPQDELTKAVNRKLDEIDVMVKKAKAQREKPAVKKGGPR